MYGLCCNVIRMFNLKYTDKTYVIKKKTRYIIFKSLKFLHYANESIFKYIIGHYNIHNINTYTL